MRILVQCLDMGLQRCGQTTGVIHVFLHLVSRDVGRQCQELIRSFKTSDDRRKLIPLRSYRTNNRMAAQLNFDQLRNLHLTAHGDALERFYWPKVSAVIPNYEMFWREFIVLLTERIDPSAATGSIRLRMDIPEIYERLLMANYSTFYYFVLTSAQMDLSRAGLESEGPVHPELFFLLAGACLERYKDLQRRSNAVFLGTGLRVKLAVVPDTLAATIRRYRNTFAHDAHLGRGKHYGRQLMVRQTRLPRDTSVGVPLWSEIAEYPRDEMVRMDELQQEVCKDLAAVLDSAWSSLAAACLGFRTTTNFIFATGLTALLPIASMEPSATSSISASGTNVY